MGTCRSARRDHPSHRLRHFAGGLEFRYCATVELGNDFNYPARKLDAIGSPRQVVFESQPDRVRYLDITRRDHDRVWMVAIQNRRDIAVSRSAATIDTVAGSYQGNSSRPILQGNHLLDSRTLWHGLSRRTSQ